MINKVKKHLNILAQILREEHEFRQIFIIAIVFMMVWLIWQ
ncbi:TPA: hypothetical protein ACY38O_000789 [Pasteurella multocida]